jgi:hypothetical protein
MKDLRPELPIVMFSAFVDLPREALALVDTSITKGEPTEVLLGAITQLLNGNQNVHARAISAKKETV